MKNILVTGGAGYIGSHAVVALVQAGYSVVVADNLANSSTSALAGVEAILGQRVTFCQLDCRDAVAMRQIVAKHQIDGVIHFAAYKAVGESVRNPLKYYANNMTGLLVLLELCEEFGLGVVFSSSATIYGTPLALPITEDTVWQPATSPYGTTKRMSEAILGDCTRASTTMRSVALRYFNPIGAHDSALIGELPLGTPNNLVPFITQAAAGLRGELTVYGTDYDTPDGTCLRDYIHVMDLAQAHVLALGRLSKASAGVFETYNIGTGQPHSVLAVIETFERVNCVKVPYVIGDRRAGDVTALYADASLAARDLGWTASRSLEQSLSDAWRWQQSLA
jgi:UDP-glucose 4-epimerase